MKLTQRQLDKIAGIISEEAEVRKNLHEGMYNSRKNSVISEALMFEEHGSLKSMPEEFVQDIESDFNASAQDLLSSKFRGLVYKTLAGYMRHYGHNMTPSQWEDELDGFDLHYEAEMEFVTDLTNSMLAFAKKVAETAVMAIGLEEEEEPGAADLEPRYSEYE